MGSRKKNTKKPAESQGPASPLVREIYGVCLASAAIIVLVSLVSYDPRDPSLNNTVATAAGAAKIHNWIGVTGAYLSDILFQLVGYVAYVLALTLAGFSITFFRTPRDFSLGLRALGGVGLILTLCGLTSLYIPEGGAWSSAAGSAGGLVGGLLARGLVTVGNRPGATIILTLIGVLAVMVATQFSFRRAGAWIQHLGEKIWDTVQTWRTIHQERKARREEVKVEVKKANIRTADKTPKPVTIVERQGPKPPAKKPVLRVSQETFAFVGSRTSNYKLPPLKLLDDPPDPDASLDTDTLSMNARLLEKKLRDFGVDGEVVEVHPGPVVTSYEFAPAPGIKVNKIVSLSDDLSLALSALSIRILAPIPGKAVVGIEVPNAHRELVSLKEMLCSDAYEHASMLALGLGKDIEGGPVVADLRKMPHLLVAGATGAGKSVSLNAMITSILYKATPDDVRFLFIDPKMLELTSYADIPHLLHPVITDPKEAAVALKWVVREMEERYRRMAEAGVRNIEGYNKKVLKELEKGKKRSDADEDPPRPYPLLVVIIDELADLMMLNGREVEESIARLAQMARAAGIHLILATQRPSVDVITGLIKANFPARISFQVSSRTDSRTILDAIGAERLLGDGDMLFLTPGTSKVQRVHGAYLSDAEIARVVEFIRAQGAPEYNEEIVVPVDEKSRSGVDAEEYDERYDEAVAIVTQTRQASISMLQRRLRVGYNRAARMIEVMERDGIVGPSDGVRQREVLADPIDTNAA